MTSPAAVVADWRRIAALLAEHSDPAALVASEAIARWLHGEDFEAALGLFPGWRGHVRQRARETALQALCAMLPDLADVTMARRIRAGLSADDGRGVRPDGERGIYRDLLHACAECSARTWRDELRKARGRRTPATARKSAHAG